MIPAHVQKAVEGLDYLLDSRGKIPEIARVLEYSLLSKGKRFRPALVFIVGELLGLEASQLEGYARAAELTHAAFLAHDDVIDESEVRRGRATVHTRVGNAKAVLAGDKLLATVVSEISQLGNVHIIQDLATVVAESVDGEWLQLEGVGRMDLTAEHLTEVARLKTASLIVWCCKTPGRVAGLDDQILKCLHLFGENLGIAFQMIDDVVDFEVTSEKPFAHDLREGLLNQVTVHMLSLHPKLSAGIEALMGEAQPQSWPWSAAQLSESMLAIRKKARGHIDAAAFYLSEIETHMRIQHPEKDTVVAAGAALVNVMEQLQVRTK